MEGNAPGRQTRESEAEELKRPERGADWQDEEADRSLPAVLSVQSCGQVLLSVFLRLKELCSERVRFL